MSGKLEMNFLIEKSNCLITAEVIDKEKDVYLIEFKWTPEEFCFSEVLSSIGNTPLPPYIKRKSEKPDKERYQTVFAVNDGSVAAPTAALHFTKEILKNLSNKNILTEYITLNVGAGTFKPVKSEKIENHFMHTESFSVNKSTLINIINSDKQIISVGTTTLRTLESLYWMGEKLINKKSDPFFIYQWYPYEINHINLPSMRESFQSIIDFLDYNQMDVLYGKTDIIIVPGYNIKTSEVLITNFHMPRSTLLLLVAAFTGDDWKKIYEYALKNNFRFLSYGDSSILFKKD